MDHADLTAFYKNYIDSINNGTLSANLGTFCCDEILYNGDSLTPERYMHKIDRAFEHLLDARFLLAHLAIDPTTEHQTIAARLCITGTLAKPWPGFVDDPGCVGAGVLIYENVFYLMHEGRIQTVWAIIELARKPAISLLPTG